MDELTRRAAVEILGWHWDEALQGWLTKENYLGADKYWDPTYDANHRDMVVEAMRERGFDYELRSFGKGYWIKFWKYSANGLECWISYGPHDEIGQGVCEKALKAITAEKIPCHPMTAAMKAVEGEIRP